MIVVRALLGDNARIWALLVTWLMILVLWSALAVYWEATAVFDSSRQTSVVYVDLDDTTCVVLISIPPYSNPTKVRTCGYLLLSISARQDCKTARLQDCKTARLQSAHAPSFSAAGLMMDCGRKARSRLKLLARWRPTVCDLQPYCLFCQPYITRLDSNVSEVRWKRKRLF